MNWIFPCNTEYFNIHKAFENLNHLNWDIYNYKVEIGDYVYIYVADPEKAIRYKCVVTDLSDTKTIDDSAYGGRETGYKANQATLQFLVTYTEPGIELSDMRKMGINARFSMQSIIHMPEELENYINHIEEESFAEDENEEEVQPEDTETTDEDLDGLRGEERDAVIKVRVNQGRFRQRLLEKYEHCCLCAVSNPQLLLASHIKPWKDSDGYERTATSNGLLLCPNHDKLFDRGLLSFKDDGTILISATLSKTDRMFMNVNDSMKIEIEPEMKKYLAFHRENCFKK